MSLILEALRKLERERDTTGRGFLVVTHTPWRTRRGHLARLALLSMAAGALAGGTAWTVWTALGPRSVDGGGPVPSTPAATPLAAVTLPPPIWETAPAARPAAPATPAPSSPPVASAVPAPTPAAAEPPLLVIAPAGDAAATLRLEAISAQDGEPVAVINGHVVRKGEIVDGALVLWIGADAVEVEVGGRRRVLGF